MKMHETAWTRVPLGDVSVINPRRPVLKRTSDAPTAFVPMSAVDESNGTIREYALRRYDEISKGYTYFEEGDILFAKITPCMQNGKHAIIHGIPGGFGFGSTEFHVIRSSDRVDANYLLHFLRQPSVLSGAAAHFQGAVGQQRVPPEYIRSLSVPLPPITEQKRIAAKLDEQMATLASAQAALAAQREAVTALRSAVLRTALDPAAHPDWRSAKLNEIICDAQSGFASGERDEHGVVQLRMNNVTSNGLLNWDATLRVPTTENIVDRYHLVPGDVLFNNTNSTELVGKSAIFLGYKEPVVFSNHFTRLRTNRTILDPAFLSNWLLYLWNQRVFEDMCNRWIGQSAVKADALLALDIPLPSLPEQRRIAVHLDSSMKQVDTVVASLDSQAATLDSLRASLLDAAFSGQV